MNDKVERLDERMRALKAQLDEDMATVQVGSFATCLDLQVQR